MGHHTSHGLYLQRINVKLIYSYLVQDCHVTVNIGLCRFVSVALRVETDFLCSGVGGGGAAAVWLVDGMGTLLAGDSFGLHYISCISPRHERSMNHLQLTRNNLTKQRPSLRWCF